MDKLSPEEAFSNVITAGLYILEPEVFDHVPVGEKFDFSKQLFPKLLELGWPMYAQTIDGVWFDVGHPFELINAQATLMQRYDELPFSYPETYAQDGDVLSASSAKVTGLVARSVLGPFTVVSDEAAVVDSMLMEGCRVEQRARVTGSVIGCNVTVPADTTVESCVIGDGAVLQAGATYTDQKISNPVGP